ncbi:MAG: General secretion pathway protein K [Candidatus Scalindua rubra]|uniref:General secretion pathway protein K n=1 Tax=Candidatus Scalindua rubra TaxID=1872076 RepID=A0A1E3X9V0_9BACT|nr:MAG: General secretion pathway protein K [Candidatus Scalindua rubra]
MTDLKNEDGYILVVVIGVLTILSLMAITFATLSRIETKATRNYTDSIKCDMVARAGLEHALYVLRLDKFGTDTTAYNNDNGDENYDWSGETWMPNGTDFSGNDYDNDGNGTPDSKWIYFPATTSALDIRLPGKLRARYAALITDDREARVNINVTGNKANGGVHTSNEGGSTFENDLSLVIEQAPGLNSADGDNIASDIIDTRLGTDLNPGTSTTNEDSGIVPDPQTDGIDNDGDWDSATHDSNNNGIPDSGETNVDEADNSESIDEPNEFNPIYPFGDDRPFGFLTEAEIMGTSTYTSRLETIFNNKGVSQSDQNSLNNWLTTYSADTIVTIPYQLDGGTSTTKLNINALVNNEGAYTNAGTYDSNKKAQMIMDVLVAGGLTGSSGSSNYVERHQLAVNIKDFIDSDGTVTAYNDGADTYYGVERTPYINEVESEVDSTATDIGGNPTGMGKFIELFNPYDTAIAFLGNWQIEFGATIVPLSGTIGSQTYYVIADDQNAYTRDGSVDPKGFSYEGGIDAEQYDSNVNSLTTNGEVLTLRDNNNNIVQVTNYGNADNPKSSQLNDPRPTPLTNAKGQSNIDSSNPWRWEKKNITAGSENDNFDPSPSGGDDGWNNTTWPSSFLVANRRFSNKGYLGFIHTGRQWYSFKVDDNITYPDTLQYFTITDPSMDNIDNDGDGSTDSSDTGTQNADIDGQEYRILGLINVNTASAEVLQSLPNVDSAIATAIEGDAQKPFSSIGNLLEDVAEITGSGTKWSKEQTFRSMSNLITTRSNVFMVYVTAQVTDEAETSIFAEKRLIAIVDRSTDPIRVRYFRWITE